MNAKTAETRKYWRMRNPKNSRSQKNAQNDFRMQSSRKLF